MKDSVKLQNIRKKLNGAFVEREDIIEGLLLALVSEQVMFLLGPAGTSKSLVCRALTSAISGNFFEICMGKTTTPEELYGPISFKGLQSDKFVRNTEGRLPTADVAFIDEIFKGSSAVLNTLLPVINERVFHNGNGPESIPLEAFFSASNEIPQGEEMAALWDRFVLRYITSPIRSDDAFKNLIQNGVSFSFSEKEKLSKKDLEAIRAEAQAIPFADEVLDMFCALRRDLQNEHYVSDRKWLQSVKILQAKAYLEGHSEILAEDLEVLQHVLWTAPEECSKIRKLVYRYANPIGDVLAEMQDAIVLTNDELNKIVKPLPQESVKATEDRKTKWGMETNSKIKVLLKQIDDLEKSNRDNKKLIQIKTDIKSLQRQVQTVCLGL